MDDVRKLVNAWCVTDIEKDGVTVLQRAVRQGSELLVKLLQPLSVSMSLAHAVLAQNLEAVQELCNETTINLNIKNMGDHNAPVLYYAACLCNKEIVQLLLSNKVKCDVIMEDQHGVDIPLILAVGLHPNSVPSDILTLLCSNVKNLNQLYYKGRNCLQAAIEFEASLSSVQVMLDCGGPTMLCDRNSENLTARDLAEKLGRSHVVRLIENTVYKWLTHQNQYNEWLKQLPELGCDHLRHACSLEGTRIEDAARNNSVLAAYLQESDSIQERINTLELIIKRGDTDKFKKQYSETSCIARPKGSGLPLLHLAVLLKQYEIVEYILFRKDPKLHIDEVRDMSGRTALHYACASEGEKHIEYILSEQGACEYIVDKRGFMPVDFRERRQSESMQSLLQRQINKDYSTPEPNPWQVKKRRSAPSSIQAISLLQHPFINPHVHPHPSHPLNMHTYGAMGTFGPMGATFVDSVQEEKVSYTNQVSYKNLAKMKRGNSSCSLL